MRAGSWMVIAGAACAACAAKQAPPPVAPASSAAAAPVANDRVAVAGDPDEGGQVAQASASTSTSTSTSGAAPAPNEAEVAEAIAGGPREGGLAVAGPPGDSSVGGGGIGTIGTGGGGMRAREPGHDARVAPGTPKVTAGLDPEIIRRIVRRNINKVRYCYERSLRNDPSYAGLLSISFAIGPEGTVTSAGARLPQQNADLEACVVRMTRSMEFPKPQGGKTVEVTYPFNLSPS